MIIKSSLFLSIIAWSVLVRVPLHPAPTSLIACVPSPSSTPDLTSKICWSCGKVMFYTRLSVILFIGGRESLYDVTSCLVAWFHVPSRESVSAPMFLQEGSTWQRPPGQRSPDTDPLYRDPQTETSMDRNHPGPRPPCMVKVVCILLEWILVDIYLYKIFEIDRIQKCTKWCHSEILQMPSHNNIRCDTGRSLNHVYVTIFVGFFGALAIKKINFVCLQDLKLHIPSKTLKNVYFLHLSTHVDQNVYK